jgi:hypothetical protein
MTIHDQEGFLTTDAQQIVLDYIHDKGTPSCCATPRYIFPLISVWHSLTLQDEQSVTGHKGAPVVSIVCANCGNIRTYLAGAIFRQWLDENRVNRSARDE